MPRSAAPQTTDVSNARRSLGHGGDEADDVVILQRLHNAGKVVLRKFSHHDRVARNAQIYVSTSKSARGLNIAPAGSTRRAAPFVRVAEACLASGRIDTAQAFRLAVAHPRNIANSPIVVDFDEIEQDGRGLA